VKGDEKEPARLVPNPTEQRQLAKMRKMRAEGASYPAIGNAIGKQPMSVKRILDRAEAAAMSATR
jgi:hypothetical protein